MRRGLWIAAVVTVLAAGEVRADALDACRRTPRLESRLLACTEVIESAAATQEQKAMAFRYRAEARMAAGALNEAIIDFTEAIALNPASATIFAGRGQARLLAGELDFALADYSEAIRLAPSSASAWLERGHVNLTKGNVDAAIADLTEAIRLNPRSASARNNRGLAHRKKGDLDRAHADYTSAIAVNPIYALAYANRGYLEEARGRKSEAIADLKTALMLDPSITGASEALRRLGSLDGLTAESERRIAQGKALVEANCSRCHAVGESGISANPGAPEFRKLQLRHALMALREPLTRGIAAPHDEMPKFTLSESEVDSIVAYINSLPSGK